MGTSFKYLTYFMFQRVIDDLLRQFLSYYYSFKSFCRVTSVFHVLEIFLQPLSSAVGCSGNRVIIVFY